MIRFDIERDILEGRLKIKDLPDAWNSRYKSDLGVTVPSFKDGCLQDVHWFSSAFGGSFQGYSIGNILSAQIYAAAKKSLPNMEDKFSKGDFQPLLQWLQNKVHRWGATRNPTDLIHHATGAELSIECYMDYLTKKYSELYSV
jgi:carboxypeptidase Taq